MSRIIVYNAVLVFNLFIILYVLIINAFNILQLIASFASTSYYIKRPKFHDLRMLKNAYNMVPMSILVPAYNESESIISNIHSLLELNYFSYEVIVINDGSTDDTLEKIIEAFQLRSIEYPPVQFLKTSVVIQVYMNYHKYPNLKVIDKCNGGKADALNVGINYSSYPYFITIDADSLLDKDALVRLSYAFMEDDTTIAVGGIVRPVNGSTVVNGEVTEFKLSNRPIVMFQVVEYLRAFLVGRTGLNVIQSLLIISGAFGAFKKETALKVGGYTTDTVGEDMNLVMKLHEYMRKNKIPYRITFSPDPICWTQVPESIRDVYKQRRRWQIGLLDCLKRSRHMLLNPRYGTVGMIGVPYYTAFELFGPIIEAIGVVFVPISYLFGMLSLNALYLFFLASVLFGVILSIGSLIIEIYAFENEIPLPLFAKLLLYAILENFGYRQMLSFARLIAVLRYKKYKHSWAKIKRQKMEV